MSTTQQFAEATNGGEAAGMNSREDLFALTDEQILEIVPEDAVANARNEQHRELQSHDGQQGKNAIDPEKEDQARHTTERADSASQNSNVPADKVTGNSQEPPRWLANMMADPQAGSEARDFWSGIQQARQEAAAFREVFAKPEEARVVAERARVLDDIDHAYFGTSGNSPEQSSAARAQLAARMMQQDPVAFREMVFAGLRALESAGGKVAPAGDPAKLDPSSTNSNSQTNVEQDARVSAYAAFEKAANDDLARSVGGVIERTLEQALPNAAVGGGSNAERTQRGGALKERLSNAIRQDVEKTLQADRQLGEQVAQILSGRRLDETARAQVVRLIGERAQQLVPVAAKRVLQDWTQTTLASHRSRNERTDDASMRRDVGPASTSHSNTRAAGTQQRDSAAQSQNARRDVDYRKVSDEQILEM